jgi:hypothetical protein
MKTVIKISFFLIAVLYLFGLGKQFHTFIDFHLHQDEIIAQFCINIEKPDMECNGQCHLKEELSQNAVKIDFVNQESNHEDVSYTNPSFDGFEELDYPKVDFIFANSNFKICQLMYLNYKFQKIQSIKMPPEFLA